MPIYEYQGSDCGHELEALQKMSDEKLRLCPECDQESLKKKISAPGFRLAGSGWYETDFKSGNQKNLSQGDSTEKPAKSADNKSSQSTDKASSGKKEAAA